MADSLDAIERVSSAQSFFEIRRICLQNSVCQCWLPLASSSLGKSMLQYLCKASVLIWLCCVLCLMKLTNIAHRHVHSFPLSKYISTLFSNKAWVNHVNKLCASGSSVCFCTSSTRRRFVPWTKDEWEVSCMLEWNRHPVSGRGARAQKAVRGKAVHYAVTRMSAKRLPFLTIWQKPCQHHQQMHPETVDGKKQPKTSSLTCLNQKQVLWISLEDFWSESVSLIFIHWDILRVTWASLCCIKSHLHRPQGCVKLLVGLCLE